MDHQAVLDSFKLEIKTTLSCTNLKLGQGHKENGFTTSADHYLPSSNAAWCPQYVNVN